MPIIRLDVEPADLSKIRIMMRKSLKKSVAIKDMPEILEKLLSSIAKQLAVKSRVIITHEDVLNLASPELIEKDAFEKEEYT